MRHDAHGCTAVELVAKHDGAIVARLPLAGGQMGLAAWLAQQLGRACVTFIRFLPCETEEPVAGSALRLPDLCAQRAA
ncbi:MAG: hypothetical protein ACREE7_00070 [Dongiaceae bacterium]